MTELLQQAFDAVSKLPPAEQNLLASWLLAEVAAEDDFDGRIAETAERLSGLAAKALEAHRAGETEELILDQL
ncbi:MAG: hypothetical protein KY476_05610 [Planctomycetes bacterium]|nr:hypothetical protein [Planctomycetota bacterium]